MPNDAQKYSKSYQEIRNSIISLSDLYIDKIKTDVNSVEFTHVFKLVKHLDTIRKAFEFFIHNQDNQQYSKEPSECISEAVMIGLLQKLDRCPKEDFLRGVSRDIEKDGLSITAQKNILKTALFYCNIVKNNKMTGKIFEE